MATGCSVCLQQGEGFAQCSSGKGSFQQTASRLGFCNELPNLDGHVSSCELWETHDWGLVLTSSKTGPQLPHGDGSLCLLSPSLLLN